jgi:hypothetical protein
LRLGNNIHNHAQLAAVTATQHHQPPLRFVSHSVGGVGLLMPGFTHAATTTRTMGVNRIYYVLCYQASEMDYSAIVCEVTGSGGSGKLIRMALYQATLADNGTTVPGALIVDAGTVDAHVVATKSISITQTISPGWFFTAISSDGTPVVSGLDEAKYITTPFTAMGESFPAAVEPVLFVAISDGAAAFTDPATTPESRDPIVAAGVWLNPT